MDLDDYDANVVASLLKLYMRELPEPLINPLTSMRLESLTGTVHSTLESVPGWMELPVEGKIIRCIIIQ